MGKAATALRRARTVVELDDPSQRAVEEADPAAALGGTPPILLDEWQRVPPGWDAVRRAVDRQPRGRAVSPDGLRQSGDAVFKQFMDNEGFRRWLTDTVLGLTYGTSGAGGPTSR